MWHLVLRRLLLKAQSILLGLWITTDFFFTNNLLILNFWICSFYMLSPCGIKNKRTNIVQSPSGVQIFATPWTAAHQASLSLTISRSFPKFMSIASVMPSWRLYISDIFFSFCSQSFPASGTFPIYIYRYIFFLKRIQNCYDLFSNPG